MYQNLINKLHVGSNILLNLLLVTVLALVLYDLVKTFASIHQYMGAGNIYIKASAFAGILCIYFSVRFIKRDIIIALMIGVLPLIIYNLGIYLNS